MAQGKILIIVHQPTSTPGRVGLKLQQRGFELDIRRPCIGQPLPDSVEEHCGAVVFGGPMSANDCQDLGFIRKEIDWMALPLKHDLPVLGICLGGQLLARHLGARVVPHPQGRAEIGYYPLRPTPEGLKVTPEWPQQAYQWHREGFELPRGATLLAQGECFPHQAFRYGESAYAIQFHPEVTQAMVHRWTVRGSHRLQLPGAQPRSAQLQSRLVHDHAIAHWLDRFLDRWLAPDSGESFPPQDHRPAIVQPSS